MLRENFVKLRPWIVLAFATLLYPIIVFAAVIRLVWKSVHKTRKNIAGEVALITGGANGLGKEIALKLAAKGCHIAVVDIDEAAAKITAKLISETYNVKAKAFKADIGQFDEVKALSQKVEEQLGPVTILVNNAGIMLFSTSVNPPPAEVQNMVNTNLMGHIWTVRVFMDKMRELGKGHIVAVSSAAGKYFSTRVQELDNLINLIHMDSYLVRNVTNEMEVCIPGFLALSHRLFGFLPKDWQTKVLDVIITPEMASKMKY